MTADQVKTKFEKEGNTFSEWSRKHGFSYRTVIAVINGVNKGRRGEAHRVAVALGLKESSDANTGGMV